MTITHTQELDSGIKIKGITNSVVLRYFDSLNAEDFAATADLFSEQGALQPPFEKPIIGRKAIASYLQGEATGMKLYPQEEIVVKLENNLTEIKISGKVNTSVFSVNVAWQFILNQQEEITYVQVKLLASPEELLSLRRK